jgi:Tol biopolymer transport system component
MSMASLRGIKENPVVSPDGERIAFAWTGEAADINEKEIYVQMVGSGSPLKLTDAPGKAETPVWSPDGRRIAYLRTGGKDNGYYAAPALPGLERKLAPAVDPPPRMGGCNFDWSPDGKSLVIADRPAGGSQRTLYLLDLSTGAKTGLGVEAPFVANPVFSPDGRRIAFIRGPSFLSHDIYVMPTAGGEAQRLTEDGRWVAGLAWSADGRRIVFSSRKTGPFSLWSIPASGGGAQPVALSGTDAYSPHIARQVPRLVYVRNKINKNLWRVKPGEGGAKELIGSTRTSFQPDYSPDGTRIAFASDRTGSYEIWVADGEGHQPMQITSFGGPQTGSPRWSRDGRWIAFDSRPDGHSDIYVVNAGGGEPRRLTNESAEDRTPFWSPDGRWVYFVSNRSGTNQIWRVPFEGGKASEVTRSGAIAGAENETGSEFYFTNLQGLWRDPASPVNLATSFPLVGWVLWRDSVYYARPNAKGLVEIMRFRPAERRASVAVTLEHKPSDYDTFAFSPDGQWLLYDRVDQVENEILLVDNFR